MRPRYARPEPPMPNEDPAHSRSHWPISILSTVSAAFNVLLPLLLVRVLTPDEVGSFRKFFLYLGTIPTFAFVSGLISGLAYWVGQPDKRYRAFQVSSILALISAGIIVSLAFLLRSFVQVHFDLSPIQSSIFAIALFGAIASSLFEEMSISMGRIWTGALYYSGFEILRTVAIVVVVFLTKSLTAVLITHTVMITLKTLIGTVAGYRMNYVRFAIDTEMIRAVWRYSIPVSIAWMFGTFVTSADQLILAAWIPASAFAFYSIGCLSLQPLYILEHSITRVVIPQISEAFARKDKKRAAALYREAVENLAFFFIPAVAGLSTFAKPIIEILFTVKYSSASSYLQVYAFSYLLLLIPFDAVARARGQAGWILRNFITFATFSLVVTSLLAKVFGPFGALSGLLLSGALMRGNALRYMIRETGWHIGEFLPLDSILWMSLLSATLSIICRLTYSIFPTEWDWFFVCGPAFGILYIVIALFVRNKIRHRDLAADRILMVTQSLNVGGLERMILSLTETLVRQRGLRVFVFAYDHAEGKTPSLVSLFEKDGIQVEAFRKPRGFSLRVVYRLIRNILKNDIQVVHCHDLGGLMYGAFAKILTGGRVRIIQTQHSFIHLGVNPRYRIYEKIFTRFADEVTVVSETVRETYEELGFPAEHIHLIENGVEYPSEPILSRAGKIARRTTLIQGVEETMRSWLEKRIDTVWILYLARLYPRKGQDHAIKLWKSLSDAQRSGASLIFVGPEMYSGEYARIEGLISSNGLGDSVALLGGTSDPRAWIAGADIFLSSSEFEGMPLGPLEAAGSGLSVLASAIPGHEFLREYVQLYPLSNPDEGAEALSSMMRELKNSPESFYRAAWYRGAPLRSTFSVKRMAEQYAHLYNLENVSLAPVRKNGVSIKNLG